MDLFVGEKKMVRGNKAIGTVAYLGGLMSLPEKFCWSWGQMIQYNTEYLCNPGSYVHYDRATASFHSFARNELAKNFLGDWLLMFDTDHSFEPDIVARMLHRMNTCDLQVLVGVYVYKNPPYSPVLYQYNDKDEIMPLAKWDESVDVFQIGSSGGGCLMVKREVFNRIERELKCMPFDIEHPYGEDHSFFRRLKKLGIEAFCCPKIEAKHLAIKELSWQDDFDKEFFDVAEGPTVKGFM
jgi:hypothetical protein